jgi:excisionase family DNA binding protein
VNEPVSELEEAIRRIVRSEISLNGTTRTAFTVKDGARYLGITEALLRKRIRQGRIQVERLGGWSIRISAEELKRASREM